MFTDNVEPQFASVAVSVGDGEPGPVPTRVSGDEVVADVTRAALAASAEEDPAGWRVAYRVVSRDGHPVTGTVDFTVTAPAAPAEGASPGPSPATSTPTERPSSTAPRVLRAQPAGEEPRTLSPLVGLAVGGLGLAGVAAGVVLLSRRRRNDSS